MEFQNDEPLTIWPPVTVWRLTEISGWAGRLDVTLAVDSTAPMIVRAIEKAARENGLTIERLTSAN